MTKREQIATGVIVVITVLTVIGLVLPPVAALPTATNSDAGATIQAATSGEPVNDSDRTGWGRSDKDKLSEGLSHQQLARSYSTGNQTNKTSPNLSSDKEPSVPTGNDSDSGNETTSNSTGHTHGTSADDDQYEPNDEPTESTQISSGTSLTAEMVEGGVDFYAITADANEEITAEIQFDHQTADIDLYLLTSSLTVLDSSYSVSDNEAVQATAPESDTYYIAVTGFSGGPAEYTLTADVSGTDNDQLNADRFEPNDQFSEAAQVTAGTYSDLTVTPGTDVDIYAVDLSSGDNIQGHIDFDHSSADLDMVLLGPDQVTIESAASTTDGETVGQVDVSTTGTYYLAVYAYDQNTAQYDLAINITDTQVNNDRLEPNDAIDTATPISSGETLSDLQIANGELDFFALDATAGQDIQSSIEFDHSSGDLDLYLLGPNQQLLDDSISVTDNEQVAAGDVPESGTYYIAVLGVGSASNSYSFTATRGDLGIGDETLGADRFEPNDIPETSVPLEPPTEPRTIGNLTLTQGDIDAFNVELTAGDSIEGRFQPDEPLGQGDAVSIQVYYQAQRGPSDEHPTEYIQAATGREGSVGVDSVSRDGIYHVVVFNQGTNDLGYSLTLDTSVGNTSSTGTNFQVTGLTAPSSTSLDSPITYTAEITNTGTHTGSQPVTATFRGTTVTTRTFSLNPGESRTLAFTTSVSTVGTYIADVSTQNDTAQASVEVVGQEFVCGQSTGDPHITTFDGASYDFMAAGDFILARGETKGGQQLLVNARQAPISDSVSNNNATAVKVGSDVVVIAAEDSPPLSINGQPISLSSGESVAVGNGGEVRKQDRTYTVYFPGTDGTATTSDEHLTADVVGDRLDLELCLHPDRQAPVEGLLGTPDGNSTNDISYANGTTLSRPLDSEDLYDGFRTDWRATGSENLFETEYFAENFPQNIVTVDDLSAEERSRAEDVLADTCLEPGTPQYRDALLDVALTGDSSYVASACQVDRENVTDASDSGGTAGVDISLTPTQQTVSAGGTTTYAVELTDVSRGLGSYEFVVISDETDIATITDATPRGTTSNSLTSVTVANNGSQVEVIASNTDTGTGTVTAMTITVEGAATGNTSLDLQLRGGNAPADESGNTYTVETVTDATVTVSGGPGDLTGNGQAATDPDGDSVYEDINGDGSVSAADVTALFDLIVNGNLPADQSTLDMNENSDGVTAADVTTLFNEVLSG